MRRDGVVPAYLNNLEAHVFYLTFRIGFAHRLGRIFKDSTRFSDVFRPRENYAATVSRCATFASLDIIAVALRCKIFARA